MYALAHRGLGEWRQWRGLMAANDIDNALNLRGRQPSGTPTGNPWPSDIEDEDIFTEFGVEWSLIEASESMPEQFTLYLQDYDEYFTIKVSSDDEPAEDIYVLLHSEVDGQDWVEFTAYLGDQNVEIRMSSEAWLLFWFHRHLTVTTSFSDSRDLLLLPR